MREEYLVIWKTKLGWRAAKGGVGRERCFISIGLLRAPTNHPIYGFILVAIYLFLFWGHPLAEAGTIVWVNTVSKDSK